MTDIQPARRPGWEQQLTTRCGGEVVLLPGNRATLTGTPAEVGQLLAAIQGTGRLVSSTTPAPTGVPGQVLVNVRLAPRLQPHAIRTERRKLPRWALGSILTGLVVLVAGAGWLIYAAVTAILANLAVALLVAGAVVVVLGLVGKAAGGGKTFSGTFKGRID